MQDIHSIGGGGGGGGGRFFGSGVDRRLRPNLHQNNQSLKCPRCDSLNTKFCYYNNYNLSQPRHFCKSCRRYWTKGGVLRNVPVGGGCRKTKRSKPKHSSQRKSNSHSSSESSSLTASTTAAKTQAATATATATASSSNSASTLLKFPESRFFNFPVQSTNPSFDHLMIDQSSDGGVFPEIGSFTSMMTSSDDPSFLGFNMGDISASGYRLHQENEGSAVQDRSSNHQWQHQQKMEELSTAFLDQTAQIDLSGMVNRGDNGGVGALDWQAGGDQGMFDLTGIVDQAYWSQTQWPDNDQSLYLP